MENKHKTFKPFDKVAVRDNYGVWNCAFYSHWSEEDKEHMLTSLITLKDKDILPYEGNEHLVGTDLQADEEIRLEEGEWLMASDFIEGIKDMYASTGRFLRITRDKIILTSYSSYSCEFDYQYVIRFSDFNPNDMEETRKHILCVKNGKIVRYKDWEYEK